MTRPALKAADVGNFRAKRRGHRQGTADIISSARALACSKTAVIEGRKTFGQHHQVHQMGSAPTSAICSVWSEPACYCRFCRCAQSRSCSTIPLRHFPDFLSSDSVDEEYQQSPPWNIEFIKKFMIFIGPIKPPIGLPDICLMYGCISTAAWAGRKKR